MGDGLTRTETKKPPAFARGFYVTMPELNGFFLHLSSSHAHPCQHASDLGDTDIVEVQVLPLRNHLVTSGRDQ